MEVDGFGDLGRQGTGEIFGERSGGAPAVGGGDSTAGNGARERARDLDEQGV
jgi:hypothetical protein